MTTTFNAGSGLLLRLSLPISRPESFLTYCQDVNLLHESLLVKRRLSITVPFKKFSNSVIEAPSSFSGMPWFCVWGQAMIMSREDLLYLDTLRSDIPGLKIQTQRGTTQRNHTT